MTKEAENQLLNQDFCNNIGFLSEEKPVMATTDDHFILPWKNWSIGKSEELGTNG